MVAISAPEDVMILVTPAPATVAVPQPVDPKSMSQHLARPLRAFVQGELGTKPAGESQEYSVDNLRALLLRVVKGGTFVLGLMEDGHFLTKDEQMHLALLSDLMSDCDAQLVAHLTALALDQGVAR